jgi:hypothetical protein
MKIYYICVLKHENCLCPSSGWLVEWTKDICFFCCILHKIQTGFSQNVERRFETLHCLGPLSVGTTVLVLDSWRSVIIRCWWFCCKHVSPVFVLHSCWEVHCYLIFVITKGKTLRGMLSSLWRKLLCKETSSSGWRVSGVVCESLSVMTRCYPFTCNWKYSSQMASGTL